MVAHAKDQGSSRESNEEERLLRLFVVVGKDVTEDELKADFEAFGTVQYVNIVKDRVTKESKGFAYIKFYRLVHAAKAFESCDKSYNERALCHFPKMLDSAKKGKLEEECLKKVIGRCQSSRVLEHLQGSPLASTPGT